MYTHFPDWSKSAGLHPELSERLLKASKYGPVPGVPFQIGRIDLLSRLAGKTVISSSVQAELLDEAAPTSVRTWATQPPAWVEIRREAERVFGWSFYVGLPDHPCCIPPPSS